MSARLSRLGCSGLIALWFCIAAVPVIGDEPAYTVRLPDFVVWGINSELPEPVWYYAELPGFEVLSSCSEEETKEYLSELQRQHRLLDYLVPKELRSPKEPPFRLVVSREHVRLTNTKLGSGKQSPVGTANTRDWDGATKHASFGLHELTTSEFGDLKSGMKSRWTNYERNRAHHLSTSVYSAADALLWRQRASWPRWLARGFMGANRVTGIDHDSLRIEGGHDPSKQPRGPLDLRKFFQRAAPKSGSALVEATSVSEGTELWFGVWAFYGRNGANRDAFWRFALATRGLPEPDEAVFQKYFQRSFPQVEKEMEALRRELSPLRSEGRTPGWLAIPLASASLPPMTFRLATETDKGRLIGEWCWRAARGWPGEAATLLAAGRRYLQRASRTERADARVAAWHGLTELALGNAAVGRPLLESSTGKEGVTLAATYELARIRYEETIKASPEGKLDAAQLKGVLELLREISQAHPKFPGAYELATDAWSRAVVPPSHDEVLSLVAQAKQFPREWKLLGKVGLLCLQRDMQQEAEEVISLGLAFADDEKTRAGFEKLRRMNSRAQSVQPEKR